MYSIEVLNFIISVRFVLFYSYQVIYCLVPFVVSDKKKRNAVLHRFAVLICARNEETVIANLLESINGQDYPQELIDVYVIADNCTDNTAQVAREHGARVYTRNNNNLVGKGYALEFLLNQIIAENTAEYYDGYFVFDADNVLMPDYITRMNRSFSGNTHIVTGYRNSKNYGDNWISAGYGLWFLRESAYLNYSRHLLGVSASVGGTGFLFSSQIAAQQDGWHYHLLTEDVQFSAHKILQGYKIKYCHDAMLFDEQPTTIKQSCTQRLRWRKGYFQVLQNYGTDLLHGAVKGSFSCYDMLANIAPRALLSLLCLVANIVYILVLIADGIPAMPAVLSFVGTVFGAYKTLFFAGLLTTITEWDKINCPTYKKVRYMFTFPLFMFTYLPIAVVAFFADVSWKPVRHSDKRTITDLKGNSRKRSI